MLDDKMAGKDSGIKETTIEMAKINELTHSPVLHPEITNTTGKKAKIEIKIILVTLRNPIS